MKRTDLVIRAMKRVVAKYPAAKLAITGSGYDSKRLELLRNFLDLQNSITFLDENVWFFSKNEKDVKNKMMRSAWALVFPSVKEGWGMTVTECAASGTPTIATNVTGLKDSVVDGKTGILVSKDPTEIELADAMIRIIEDNELRKRLSKNALSYSKRFTWERSYEEFMTILQKVNKS